MPFAVLIYLAQRPEQVVSGKELLNAVWGGTYVSHTVVRVCVREIRRALEDEVVSPRYIETVGQQGYRFIAPITTTPPVSSSKFRVSSSQSELAPSSQPPIPNFVGRENELAQLHKWAAQARQGQRRMILVSGEAGIGKSTLANQFVSQVCTQASVWVSLGQCVETYGRGEAYLPILDALSRLGREMGSAHLAAVLQQHAPTWLIQLPALLTTAQRETLQGHVVGATPERMLRELSEALEVLSADQLGILVLDDLQWSDTATLAWLAAWARRPEPARLLLIGTYRPGAVVARESHPLRGLVQELRVHGMCQELRPEFLTKAEVKEYVRLRLADSPATTTLATHIYQRTDGNPLFMVTSLDDLIRQHVVVEEAGQWRLRSDLASLEADVPDDLEQLITRQIEALRTEEQRVLEVASVVGITFTAAEVAAGCKQEEEMIDDLCAQLAQRGQFLAAQEVEEWPDGTVSARYGFRHVLYQRVLYERLGRAQQMRRHRLIGERAEAAYRGQEAAVAGMLAAHFAEGRGYAKAVRYHQLAAKEALRRSAYQEVIQHSSQGLALLAHLPAATDRARQELALHTMLSTALAATQGFAAETLSEHLQRAHALCQEVGDSASLVPVLIGLGRLYQARGDRTLTELMERERCLLAGALDASSAIQLATQLCTLETFAGCHIQAQAHYAQVVELSTAADHPTVLLTFGIDPLVIAAAISSSGLWLSGQPEQARCRLEQGLTRAETLGHPTSLAHALFFGVFVRLCRGELDRAQQLIQRLVALSHEQGFSMYKTAGVILQGCLAVQRGKAAESTARITDGLMQIRGMNVQIYMPFFLSFLATGYWQQCQAEDALRVITEALQLTEATLEVFWQAELHRLKGELTLAQSSVQGLASSVRKNQKAKGKRRNQPLAPHTQEVEACFRKAIEIAQQQGAKPLELRAVMSLSRLWQHQGKTAEARQVLAEIYHWFTEGFDTKDLQEAKVLLAELS